MLGELIRWALVLEQGSLHRLLAVHLTLLVGLEIQVRRKSILLLVLGNDHIKHRLTFLVVAPRRLPVLCLPV